MSTPWNSNFEKTIPFSDDCWQLALATNTDKSFTIPGTAQTKYSMLITYTSTSNVFVCLNATATVPSAGTATTQFYEEFRPCSDDSRRYVKGGDVVHFITPDASAYVGISLMLLPG